MNISYATTPVFDVDSVALYIIRGDGMVDVSLCDIFWLVI